MVDLTQWRACIGLWSSCKTVACRSTQFFHPNLCETVARDKSSSVISLYLIPVLVYMISSAILGFLSNVASLLFPGIIASCSSAHICLVLAGGSASILVCIFLYLIVRLLLFLSGDIELNPGPLTGDPKETLRKCSQKLVNAISTTLLKVTNALYAKDLIPQETKEEVHIPSFTPYNRASILVIAIEKQLDAYSDPNQYFNDVFNALRNQGNRALTDLVNSILGQSDEIEPYPDCVKEYADILKQRRYKKLSIINTDWPPKVGNDDVFGRLALIQQNDNSPSQENNSPQNDTSNQQKESSVWYLLRGRVDEICHLTGNVKLNIEDILKPTKYFLSDSTSLIVLIDGPPGIGKTTLCRKLLHMWSDGELIPHYDLVLYCPLRDEKIAEAKTLADLFVYKRHNVSEIVDLFKGRNGEGMLIIFDGWDELSTKLRESSLAAGIIRREQLDQCSVIVTSRSYASSSLIKMSSLNKQVHVIGFSKDEIAKVIIQTLQKDKLLAQKLLDQISVTRWYIGSGKKAAFLETSQSNEESQLAVKLINDLKKRSDVESLCFIPFICSIVISVYRKEKQLKTTLTELYENFILQTIKRQIEKQGCTSYVFSSLSSLPVELAEPFEEICQFAYTSLANNNQDPVLTFSSHQIIGMSAAKNKYFGLLTTFIDHEEKYQFIHLTIQEFLAAWWIAKQPNPEQIFHSHFENDHFRMCLRFVAGLTKLSPHENYEQYFNKSIDLQCKARRLFGFDARYQSYFYTNPIVEHVHHDNFLTHVDHFPIPLLHLLYESQNKELCQTLALFISPRSICLHALELSLFDILCLNYFLNANSTTCWNHLHLMPLYHEELSVLTSILNTNRLDVHFCGLTNDTILQLRNVQECYIEVSATFLHTCDVLVQFLSFSQIKILHLKLNESIEKYNMEHCCCSDLKKCLAGQTTLQEFYVEHRRANRSQNADIQTKVAIHEKKIFNTVIEGICKNTSITFLSLQFDINTYSNRQRLVESELMEHDLMECDLMERDLMKRLFKENKTLRALSGSFVSLRILETINTPLVATDGNSFIPGLECILLSKLHPSHVINPSLVVTGLALNSPESAIEFFDILKTDNKLKALRLHLMPEAFSFTSIFKNMSTSMKEMLQENQTLECLEINTGPDILPFFSCLVTGLEKNETLKQLSLPIPLSTSYMYNENNNVKDLFSLLSCKKNLTELQLYFHGHNPGHTIIATDDDTIFQLHVLPMITTMLLSNGKIEVLSLNIRFFGSPMHNNAWEKFINAVLNHPSLQHVVLKLQFQSTELKEFLRELVKELKKASPIIICETDKRVYF